MAKLQGVFSGASVVKFKDKKGNDDHFRKAAFIEKGGSGKAFDITVSDEFVFEEFEPVEIDVKIEQKGFNISITLVEE